MSPKRDKSRTKEKAFENTGTEMLAIPNFIYVCCIIMNKGANGVAISEWT